MLQKKPSLADKLGIKNKNRKIILKAKPAEKPVEVKVETVKKSKKKK